MPSEALITRMKCAKSPNDPKLSDRGVRRGTCTAGGKAAAEAGAVTHGAVRCSAWLGVCWSEFDMRILQYLAVHSHKWRIENASRRDNNLVCGVAVELTWKLSGLDTDAGRKLDEPDAGIRERLLEPIEYGTWQSEPPALDELGDLPARNRAHCDAGLLGGIKQRTGRGRK